MINSKTYWDERFSNGSWDEFAGGQQTLFFNEIALRHFPSWLAEDIEMNEFSITDVGCAKGEGTNLFKKYFSRSKVVGIDFSESAIKAAEKNYPACHFCCCDIDEIKEKYDVVFSSNVLEHFKNPFEKLEKLFEISNKYVIVLLPFQEDELHVEHFTRFDYSSFTARVKDFYQCYYKVIDTNKVKNTMWPGKQILLVYINEEYVNQKKMKLSRMHNGDFEEKIQLIQEIEVLKQEMDKLINTNRELEDHNKKLENNNITLENHNKQLEDNNRKLEDHNTTLENNNKQLEDNNREKDILLKEYHLEKENLLSQHQDLMNKYELEHQEKIVLVQNLDQLNNLISTKDANIVAYQDILRTAKNTTTSLINTKIFKGVHLTYRMKHQLLKGNLDEKKNFFKWLIKRNNKRVAIEDHSYNPMYQIIDVLDEQGKVIHTQNQTSQFVKKNNYKLEAQGASNELSKFWNEQKIIADKILNEKEMLRVDRLKKIINQKQYKGIIIYPHIVNWEPLQTPQQILRQFARKGYLCLFSENVNTNAQEVEIEPNIILTNDEIIIHVVEDKEVIVLCTWIPMLPIIEKIPNKIIWYHVLDQIDIFSGYCDEYERLHNLLVKEAEVVSYVAQELKKCLCNREEVIYLPNGCHTEDFVKNIHLDYTPGEMEKILASGKKVIGYYGYIANWFDMKTIYELALRHEDWVFLLIGECIADFSEYAHERIIMMGRKPYNELADYAKYFDVATIPFEISEMMDCVSPIKFFEYAALGLPVVSSYMKEMEQYKGDTVFVAHNIDEFDFYIKRALDPEIKDLAKERGKQIALENTWAKRVETIEPSLSYAAKKNINSLLKKKYDKFDILFLSVIDYDFRYQRPQHLANAFSKEGHRVFYINANYNNTKTNVVKQVDQIDVFSLYSNRYPAIHIADYTDNSQDVIDELEKIVVENGIRDCVIVVEYPTWVQAAKYFKDKYGFKIITDYLDDYTGFEDTNIPCLAPCCYELLSCSDQVIASSNYLAERASEYNQEVKIIRNGTEFEHFHQAYQITHKTEDRRKVVGYYGAIAHWFDFDKILYLAKEMPDVDIVLIGEVTEGADLFNKYPNIKLLGEKNYNVLPKYLQDFDVSLIPFDTSTDLIKATNPVKFYEYLSAAKKVVATEIPELEPFKDRYVYLSNDNEEFLEYVRLCLDGKDTLAAPEECIEFAKQNDWMERGNTFINYAKEVFPKVSIILLTYNQLDYTKECLNSIMDKTAYPNYEIIIVDNDSTDDTPQYLQEVEKKYEQVKIILNKENYGFAKGNNIGIEASDGDYIILLNNDTVVTRGWLTGLTKHFERNQKLGILGPVTNSISNESKINVNYIEISDMEHFAYEYTTENMGRTYDNIDVLAMFCLAISRPAFEKIGYLEELYGIGMFEDDDYSYKTRSLGYDIKCAEDVFVHHYGNVSFKKLEDKKYMEIFNKNRSIFEERWGVTWKQHSCRPGVKN